MVGGGGVGEGGGGGGWGDPRPAAARETPRGQIWSGSGLPEAHIRIGLLGFGGGAG